MKKFIFKILKINFKYLTYILNFNFLIKLFFHILIRLIFFQYIFTYNQFINN